MSNRFLITICIFLSILFLPYWLYLSALFAAIIFLPMYWEGVLLGFLIDVLYGGGVALPLISPVALVTLAAIIILLPIRTRIRNYV